MGTKKQRVWDWISYGEFLDGVVACSSGLATLGVLPGDRVSIISGNSVEWATAAYATYGRGATFVAMYPAQKAEEWRYILKDSGAKVLFAADDAALAAGREALKDLPLLERVVGIHLPSDHPDSFGALLAAGRNAPVALTHPEPSQAASFIYTAGTTGNPKGVVLSHENQCSNCDAVTRILPLTGDGALVAYARSLAFLPWAHVFGQTAELHYFIHEGGSLAINDDVAHLVENLGEVRPTVLIAVPRIFNRIHGRVMDQMAERPRAIRALFNYGMRCADRKTSGRPLGPAERAALAVCDRVIFSKIRSRFGGKLEMVVSGSAALSPDVARFISAIGLTIYEGYGLSETSPVVAANRPGHTRIGSVGPVLPGVRVELDKSKGKASDEGEIIVYGPNVMQGYHNLPDETASTLGKDGGLRTGDLGRFDADGFLFITGRIKELYKLENGKYIAPAAVEEMFKLSPAIANAVLYGANRAYAVALIVPDLDHLEHWAREGGVELGDIANNARVNAYLMEEIKRHGAGAKSYERPRKIAVLKEDFTTENGLLTPKLSVRRERVVERYSSLLENLY